MNQRMGAWLVLLLVALVCGLPLNHVTIFWVGIMSAWAITTARGGEE